MKYWILYWKNIEDMTKEELQDNLEKALGEIGKLSWIILDNKTKNIWNTETK